MAITRSFGGQTLLKPGAYSVARVDNAQSLNVGDNDTIMLIGEATNGTSSNSGLGEGTSRVFNSANVQSLVDYYVSGDIVDAALAAVRPSITAGVSGPGQFVVYKTNDGDFATQILGITALEPVAGDFVRFEVPVNASGETADVDLIWGTDISLIPAPELTGEFATRLNTAINASPALQNFFTSNQPSILDIPTSVLALTAVKQGPQFNAIKIYTFTASGGDPVWTDNPVGGLAFGANPGVKLPAASFVVQPGTARLGETTTSQLNEAFSDAFNFDPNVIVPLWSNAVVATGSRAIGSITASVASSTAARVLTINFTNGEGTAVNVALPSFAPASTSFTDYAIGLVTAWNSSTDVRIRDYTATVNTSSPSQVDITADEDGQVFNMTGFTASSSQSDETLTLVNAIGGIVNSIAAGNPNAGTSFLNIDATLAATQLQSHLIQRSSTSVRKEAQGMIGGRFADWQTSFNNSTTGFNGVTSFLIQAFIQDVRIINSLGALEWKAPHVLAAMAAGIRLGTTVGEPLTFKFVNANNVAHHVNTSTGNFSGSVQFKPGFDFNVAIQNGITFTELASGGSRIVVDNTRYVKDDSFIFNRGSVIEAAQFVAKSSRQLLERIFVGNKVSNGAALSLKNVLRNYLIELNQDNIITSSTDAPFGFVEDTFTVSINGNTAEIQVEIKPVQGLDFIFINFTLGNITQQA